MKLQGTILVGTDFSAASDEALRQALELASSLGTNLTVCHVVPELDTVNILFRNSLTVTRSTDRHSSIKRSWMRGSDVAESAFRDPPWRSAGSSA